MKKKAPGARGLSDSMATLVRVILHQLQLSDPNFATNTSSGRQLQCDGSAIGVFIRGGGVSFELAQRIVEAAGLRFGDIVNASERIIATNSKHPNLYKAIERYDGKWSFSTILAAVSGMYSETEEVSIDIWCERLDKLQDVLTRFVGDTRKFSGHFPKSDLR